MLHLFQKIFERFIYREKFDQMRTSSKKVVQKTAEKFSAKSFVVKTIRLKSVSYGNEF